MCAKYAAKHEYETAKTAVWWDMNDCPIPEGYDVRRVRPSIEEAFKKRGYSGPVSITAYGDQTQTPDHLLRGLSSTGVAVVHTISESTCSLMFSDMVDWRGHNPPPATMMLISNQVDDDVFSFDLVRLQQQTKYNFFLAYSIQSNIVPILFTSKEWRWEKLLRSADEEIICSETGELSAMFYCKSCNFDVRILEKFRNHLSSKEHALEEVRNPTNRKLAPVTRMWERNYAVAEPEYATAKTAVWWVMNDCPIPEGYDVRRVRPSIEEAFKELGYSGPVSITAYGDQTQTPDHLLRGLSSTGVAVAHTLSDVTWSHLFSDLLEWRSLNPPPATIMLISNQVEDFARSLAKIQLIKKYNLFLAYSIRPYKMSRLVTSAEWLWESLLAVSETRRHVLQKCSGERGESTGMFYCKSCDCDYKSFDNFRKHLSSKEHALEDGNIIASIQLSEYERWLEATRRLEVEDFPKSKRFSKAFRMGFRLHNHLHLVNRGSRGRARKSQTCKKKC